MKRQALIDLVLANTDGYECYPFNGPNSHEKVKWTVIKHQKNDKILAMIFELQGQLLLNLKLDPEYGDILCKSATGVFPGYHMNKKYWNTIAVNLAKMQQEQLVDLIKESAAQTQK